MGKVKWPAVFPKTVNAQELASLVGLSERRIFQLRETGIIPLPEKDRAGYPFRESLRAIFDHYQQEAQGLPAKTATARARQANADADNAEMNAARGANVLMLTADARRLWDDGFAKIRDIIQRDRSLTTKQKAELSTRLQKIKLEE